MTAAFKRCRRRPTLPRPLGRSTIGAVGLNDRVRNGNGCGPYARAASDFLLVNLQQGDSGGVVDREVGISSRSLMLCLQCSRSCLAGASGVVKPHGRLGPLRSECVATRPRAAYRRGGLPRPFRRLEASGRFILGRASHLDAFSGYHSRPSLPGAASGETAGTRAGRPTRSSRTRVRSPQPSNARSGYRPNCLTTF